MKNLIYLASPYTHASASVRHDRWRAAVDAVGALHKAGHHVYSPIALYHSVANQHDLPKDVSFWQEVNENYMSRFDAIWVLMLDGWNTSTGVRAEVLYAIQHKKPLAFVSPASDDYKVDISDDVPEAKELIDKILAAEINKAFVGRLMDPLGNEMIGALSTLATELHRNAVAKGFWGSRANLPGDPVVTDPALTDPVNKLMLIISELAEAFEFIRQGHALYEWWINEDGKPDGPRIELADAIIRILDVDRGFAELSGALQPPIGELIAKKHAYNTGRPFLHGKQF